MIKKFNQSQLMHKIKQEMSIAISLLFTPDEVLVRGFRTIKALPDISCDDYNAKNIDRFTSYFGVTPTVVSFVWSALLDSPVCGLDAKDHSEKGFQKILTAIHFLWARPRSNGILATTCGYNCTRHVEGENLWKYVKSIAYLKTGVIVWPDEGSSHVFFGSIDGIDFKTREKSTKKFNQCPKQFTYKHHHCGVKYELVVHPFLPKILSINGPFRGGLDDREMYANRTKDRVPEGKVLIADRGYRRSDQKKYPGWNKKFSFPSLTDSKRLSNFKSRVRCRHEGVNGRLVSWCVLNQEFKHPHHKHVFAFEAVCVLVQYSMDHGHPIWQS